MLLRPKLSAPPPPFFPTLRGGREEEFSPRDSKFQVNPSKSGIRSHTPCIWHLGKQEESARERALCQLTECF